MAVTIVGVIHVYTGLSTDTKPISGVRAGSLFHEEDTGHTYRLDVSGSWRFDESSSLSVGVYREGVSELRVLLEGLLLETRAANKANDVTVS